MFILNNWVFLAILAVVFWGTLFPVFSEWITDRRIQVGPAFFNRMTAPLALLLLLLTGVGPLIAWRRATPANLKRQFLWPAAALAATAALCLLVSGGGIGFYQLGLFSLGAFVIASVAQEFSRAIGARMRNHGEGPLRALLTLFRKNQRRYGGYVVHLGVVFILIGAAGAGFNEERLENLAPGDSLSLRNYELRYLTARPLPNRHYGGAQARLALFEGGRPVATLAPEKRMYWLQEQPASIPSIRSTLREDLYVVLTAVEPNGSATFKVYRNPLVNWIWIGGVTFVVGTLITLWPAPVREGPRGREDR